MKKLVLLAMFLTGCATTVKQDSELLATKEGNENLVIMYEAAWCPACKQLKPILQEVSTELKFKLVTYDVEELQDEGKELGLFLPFIPVLTVYKDGKLYYHGPATDGELILAPFINEQ